MTEVKLPTHGRFRNLTGQKFGRLRVISFKGMENSRAVWNFECDCGKNLPLTHPIDQLRKPKHLRTA